MKLLKTEEKNNGAQQPAEGQPIPEFYTNAVFINVSPFDFEVGHALLDSRGIVKGAINIRMSPQTAASFKRALEQQIEAYEKQFGKIIIPDAKS